MNLNSNIRQTLSVCCLSKIFNIMKLSVVLCLLTIFCASAKVAHSQVTKISLQLENVTLKQALDAIKQQSEYSFWYRNEEINLDKKVSAQLNNQHVSVVLTKLLAEQGLTYMIDEKHIIIYKKEQENGSLQRLKKISGTVKDAKGQTIIGTNVVIKGSTNGTVTDVDGKFSLDVPEHAVLQISYIGYITQEMKVDNNVLFNIILTEDTESLDEVVVIGYGVVKKSDLTGSVSRVSTDELNNLPVSSIDKALQGRAAGVQISSINGGPGAGTSIRIRGGNSISADNEPLYVIDGFIGGGDLNALNPSDIESIEILKDAAATAIYGSRGANGVIMITTKKGKEGTNKINLSFYQGFQSLPRKLPFMNGREKAQFANDYADFNNTPHIFPDMSKVTDTDWQDEITRTAPVTNADVSISGGNKDFQHYISANYFNQAGIYESSGFTRYQMRINLDKNLLDWMKVGIQTNASSLHTDNPKTDYSGGMRLALTCIPVKNENGRYTNANPVNGELFNNPVAMNELLKNDTYTKRFLGNFYVEINPIKNLIIRSTIGADYLSGKTEYYEPGVLPARVDQQKGGKAKLDYQNYFALLNENTANYSFNINENHRFNLLAGMTVQKEEATTSYIQVEGFSNDLMEFHNLAAGDASTSKYGSNYTASQMLSFLGRINYSLYNKYLLTLTGRYDGSSRLAANHKWAFFPSAALAWRLSEEEFIKNLNVFHNLKLRASYGLIGNQAIGVYQSLASLNVVSPTLGGEKQTGYLLGNIANPDLKWETTSQFDLGLEAAFWGGRLSVELDYYHKITSDLLMNVEIPWTSGYKTQLQNMGKVRNQGVEMMLNATLINTKDWSWDLNFNISRNRNKVLDINGADYIDVQNGVRLYKNQPAGVFVGAVYDGTWKSQVEIDANPTYMPGARPGTAKFKDVNKNGKYDGVQDYDILGSAEPDFFGGFGTNVRYKRVDLELFFQGSYGNEVYNTQGSALFFGDFGANLFKKDKQPWSKNNPDSDIPAAGAFPYNVNINSMSYSPNVQDGSFLKLKTLKLGYTLPANSVSWINKLNVYMLFNNLFTLTKYKLGYDPDVTGNHAVARGVDGMAYPQNRSVQVGFNVEF